MLYQPKHFDVDDRAAVLEIMRAHPLVTLLSHDADGIDVSHVPLQPVEGDDGLRLIGHVAKANPHWKKWVDGRTLTAIFHGPQAYVSPSWYASKKMVPTWNYVVVHAHGPVHITHDSADKEHILKQLIDQHDPPYHRQWIEDLDEALRESMKAAIVGFEISVERLEAKFKLSQNRGAADQAGVLTHLQAGDAHARATAQWMRRLGVGV